MKNILGFLSFLVLTAGVLAGDIAPDTTTGKQVFNVCNYGAVGDGVNNDYPAIQSAWQALTTNGGGVLFFPANLTYRITNFGVNGITITNGQSNVRITGGGNATLLLDNLSNGVAGGSGIMVYGPATNILIENLKIKFAQMSASRQGGLTAPIYFLGANNGNGDGSHPNGWYRGNPNGTENPAAIDAGAVKNVRVENVTVENSPTVGIGIVGVDGIVLHDIKMKNTWADGLYHLNFRNSQIDGVYGQNIGDDAISLAAYESDLANSCITNAFHGEGTRVANVFIDGTYPPDGATNASLQNTSGGFCLLGVRDVNVNNYTVNDKYRALRFESGTETVGVYSNLNINNLANRNININNFVSRNCTQIIAVTSGQSSITNDSKWWLSDVNVRNFTSAGGQYTFTLYADPATQNVPVMAGYNFDGLSMHGYSQPYGTFNDFTNCTFQNMYFDGPINFNGFVPYAGNPDATNNITGVLLYPSQNSRVFNIHAQEIGCVGLKGVHLDDMYVEASQDQSMYFSTCADITFGSIYLKNLNFTNTSGGGLNIDSYCRRITGGLVELEQDNTNWVNNAVSINTTTNTFIKQVVSKTQMNSSSYQVADNGLAITKQSQVGRVDYYNGGETGENPQWRTRTWGGGFNLPGGNFDYYPGNMFNTFLLEFPLSANVTATLHDDAAQLGDICKISRVPSCTGNFSIKIQSTANTLFTFPPGQTGSAEFIYDSFGWQLYSTTIPSTPAPLATRPLYVTNGLSLTWNWNGSITNFITYSAAGSTNSYDKQLTP